MKRRRVIVAGVAVVLVLVVVLITAAVRSVQVGCNYPAPQADLPNALRAQGDFSQPLDAHDSGQLQQLSMWSAAALYPDLIGVQPGTPVRERSSSSARPDAVVVPLLDVSRPPQVVALAIYLTDCSGRLHYSEMHDISKSPLSAYPVVTTDDAANALGPNPVLIYTDDPVKPVWQSAEGASETPAT